MNQLTIKTNNHWYTPIPWCDLPKKQRDWFDYVEGEDQYSPRFVRYKRIWRDLGEFMRIDRPCYPPQSGMDAWAGAQGDSYFSGVLCRYDDDGERVQMGTYYS
jgi:hypothetical protein